MRWGRDGAWYLSDSIVALARADGVSTAINRPALAASLINYHLDAAETYFEAIRRVPAGRALTTGPSGATSERDRDPAPTEQAVEWITEADIPHFSTVLERALGRALSVGRPSIFLSGGIDSVALATLRLRPRARDQYRAPHRALSRFPGSQLQRGARSAAGGGRAWDAADRDSVARMPRDTTDSSSRLCAPRAHGRCRS